MTFTWYCIKIYTYSMVSNIYFSILFQNFWTFSYLFFFILLANIYSITTYMLSKFASMSFNLVSNKPNHMNWRGNNKIHLFFFFFFNCLLSRFFTFTKICLNNLLVLMHLPSFYYLVPVYEKILQIYENRLKKCFKIYVCNRNSYNAMFTISFFFAQKVNSHSLCFLVCIP